ncbi:hypothetical protein Esti_006052 [Eimeria stiedai]
MQRNKDRSTRRVRAVTPDSVNFSVAPGMSATFVVTFHPSDQSSYAYDLVVETERERFLVPLRAFHGLCQVDLPPIVVLGRATVCLRKETTALISNTGTAGALVSLETRPPFGVYPSNFFLQVGGSQQVVFTIESSAVGKFESPLKIEYDDGRQESRLLHGEVCEVGVVLSASCIVFEKTFVNLTSERTICIENHSNEHLPFSWSFESTVPQTSGPAEAGEGTEDKQRVCPDLIMSSSFSIKPAFGRIWARSKRFFHLEFTPERASCFNATLICNIAGREKGLRLALQGAGTGPQARFTARELDFGEVVVHTKKLVDVDLVNLGDIAAAFFMKSFSGLPAPGKELSFSPSKGCINVNKSEKLQALLCPTFLGPFEVQVAWAIEASPEEIVLTVKGRAIPPQIKPNVDSVEFGVIPFGFEEVRTLILSNTSDAEQVITAGIVRRNEDTYADITVKPTKLAIPARESRHVHVVLRPSKAQTYFEEIVFDLPGLTQNYLLLPLRGSSKTPQVALEPDSRLIFDDVFVNTPSEKAFLIRNTSRLSAQFSIIIQLLSDRTRMLRLQPGGTKADIVASPSDGLIPASATTEIALRLYPFAPGEICSTCRVIIAGLETPFELQLYACASGPKLKVEPKELQWGKISCLDEVRRQLEVTNVSPIPATFRCSVKSKHEYFVTQSSQLTLQGGASTTVDVTAIFTEAVTVVGQLVITVLDGQDTIVTLKGQAVGSPVIMTPFDASIDFQQVCTTVAKCRSFTLTNLGSRARQIAFLDGSRNSAGRQANATQPKFVVKPSEFKLGPNCSRTVDIEAFSLLPGRASQVIICQESLGASATPLRIARTVATADFFTPALLAKPSPLIFQHIWKPGDGIQVLRESLVLTNVSPIDLKCKAKTTSPFVVEPQYFSIKPQSTAVIAVSFDASFNGKQSAQVNKSLEISFEEHPKTEVISLEATAEFPNIELESTMVDFGFIVNETTKRIPLRIKNNSSVPVSYGWYLSDTFFYKPIRGYRDKPSPIDDSAIPIHEIFDFTPFSGTLEPGADETIYIRYWGLPDHEVSAVAVCSVEHGPDYPVRLLGRASRPHLKISETAFDFGEVPYLKSFSAEVYLVNFGLVDLNYAIDLGRVKMPWTTIVSERKGIVRASQRLKVELKFMPGMPTDVSEQVFFEVDHHDPIAVTLRARGTYPCLIAALPRTDINRLPDKQKFSRQLHEADPTAIWRKQAELDRQNLCKIMIDLYKAVNVFICFRVRSKEQLIWRIRVLFFETFGQNTTSVSSYSQSQASENLHLSAEFPAVVATPGRYVLDFGSVVVGQEKTKLVQLRNVSPQAFGFKIKKKGLPGTGFSVEPDFVNRLQPNEQFALALTAKNETEGETSFPLTLVVSGGIAYQILLKATFVIPDLQISTDKLEFGVVRRGLRKTLTLRLRNEKSVSTHWRHRTVIEKADRAQNEAIKCFVTEPKQSVILPGGWIDVKIHFYPERAEKEVCASIVLCLDDNPRWKCIVVTGAPAPPCLEFIPPVVDLGHCLPSHTLRQEILVRNHSQDRCELYSLEFDDQYKKTVALLRDYDGFDEAGIALLPVRQPGKSCWSRVVKAAMRTVAAGEHSLPHQAIAEEAQAVESSSDESCDSQPYELPNRVLPPHRQSAIILGPAFCGKCRVANHLGAELRRILTLDDCVDWALAAAGKKKKLAAAGADVARDVEELIRLFETQDGDGDYLWGKKSPAKLRAAKGDRQGLGSGLPLHVLSAAVKLRVAQPDCYAGTVFWVEPSLYCPSASDAGLAIARALLEEDLMIVTIKFGQLESALQEGELSSNPTADGVAYYRELVARTLQRERELVELLDGKGQEPMAHSRSGGSPSGSDSRKKKLLSGKEAENRSATTHLPDADVERFKEELLSLQHTRQQIEANLYSSKAAQAFVQEQIATYCAAESELLKESRDELNRFAALSNAPGSSRRASQRQSFRETRRTIVFSTAYLEPAMSSEALLDQIQPLRKPVIPAEPPLPGSELVEVVHYPLTPPKATQPTNLVLLSPLGSAFDKIEDEDSKGKCKRTRDAPPPGSMKLKLRQDKGGEDEGLAVRLAVEPGYIKATRWILEPYGEQRILLKFSADEEGCFFCDLQFCIVGDSEIFRLEAKATCCLPKLANFPQDCFECATQERLDRQILKKTYVVKEDIYEWGPLLTGRSAGLIKTLYSKGGAVDDLESVSVPPELEDFMTPLLLRNDSPFDTLVKGSFAGGLGAEGADATRGRKAQKNHQTADPTFLLFPPEVMIAKNGTACMHLWCLPKCEGEITDKLILTLSDNPRPFEIKLLSRCIAPKINIQTDNILFGRVLIGNTASRLIRIENPTPFPVRWSFTSLESPHKCFAFTPEGGGILEPFSSEALKVDFEAPAKSATIQGRLVFKCVDVEGVSIGPETKAVSLLAEAFSMESGVELPSKTHVLDFGKVQAYQEAEIQFTVYNKGKYPVHFDIDVSNPRLGNILSVEPHSGELKPGEIRKGVARLCAKREIELVGDVELPILIKDSENGLQMDPPPQPLQVVALVAFNEISLSPPCGLNFGPVESGKTTQLFFDLENKGRFTFDWYLVSTECMFAPVEETPRQPDTTQNKERPRQGKSKLQGKPSEKIAGAAFGPFKVIPVRGQLDPGSKVTIQAEYSAQGDSFHALNLALLVNGVKVYHGHEVCVSSVGPIAAFFGDSSAPSEVDSRHSIRPAATYFLQGQSSIPYISFEPEELFHDQVIVPSMEDALALWERSSTAVFVEDENCLCFGPVILGSGGHTETIRVENPQLIPAEIVFELKQASRSASEKSATLEEQAFDVQPRRITVAAQDYAYAALTFKPSALQQYFSFLRIVVEKASNPQTAQTQFELRGEGTLPSITLAFPASTTQKSTRSRTHGPIFDFGRVANSRAVTVPVVLKNEGIVTATARSELPPSSCITFDLPSSLTLQPKEERTFNLTYRPLAPGDLDYKFRISTHCNPFENVEYQLRGAAFVEELVWSLVGPEHANGLNSGATELADGNSLVLNEVPLGEEISQALVLRNLSTHTIYFELNTLSLGHLRDVLNITPASGSITADDACLVNVSFKSEEPLAFSRHALVFNTFYSRSFEACATGSKPSQKLKGKGRTKQVDAKAEVSIQERGDSQPPDDLKLYLTAATDERRCELSVSSIRFEATMLFSKKVCLFTISNPSAVTLPFELYFEKNNERDDPLFYELSVNHGCIYSSQTQQVQLRFAPRSILEFERTLVCRFPDLHHGFSDVKVQISASAIRPICHIELPPSDYLKKRLQSSTLADTEHIGVLELQGTGVGVRYTRRVVVYNPTAADLEFECKAVEVKSEHADSPATGSLARLPFKCLAQKGKILAGKKTELAFEYLPTRLGICEQLWSFSIPARQLVQTLLLVGRANEPHVNFETTRVFFPPTIVGRTAEQHVRLQNKECIPVTFHFDKTQAGDAAGSELRITPQKGSIGPESSILIHLHLCLKEEKKFSGSVFCKISQKVKMLRLDVKGESYYLMPYLKYVDKDGERTLGTTLEEVHFGCVLAGQKKQGLLLLGNDSKYDFSFRWIATAPRNGLDAGRISIQPADGFVPKGRVIECVATYSPEATSTTDSLHAVCEVQGKKFYVLLLKGSCRAPKVSFSFTSYDFGSFFLAPKADPIDRNQASLQPKAARVCLKIINTDPQHECTIVSGTEPTGVFNFQPVQTCLSPEEAIEIPITFNPREPVQYKTKVPFFVNEHPVASLQLLGRGLAIRLEVQSLEDQTIKFQPVLRGKGSSRSVSILNRSEKAISFFLESPEGQFSWRPLSSSSEMLTLQPKQSIDIEFLFRPTESFPEFKLPLVAACLIESCQGQQTVPVYLCAVSGKCFTTELRLRPPSVAFGPVIVGSWTTQDVLLSNIGELPISFRFANSRQQAGMISINPLQGTLQPRANLAVTVTFHPTKPTDELEINDIVCFGNAISIPSEPPTEVARLHVKATGRGVALPADSMQVLTFATSVRSSITKTFYIKNTRKAEWTTTPRLSLEFPKDVAYFSCSPSGPVTIPPNEKAALQITYHPLTMTLAASAKPAEHRPSHHIATVFCALPGGEACCIRMIGTALEPSVEQVVEAVATCKQQTLLSLRVKNWLDTHQSFVVESTILQPAGSHGIQLQAPSSMEIPGSQARDYKVVASALKPCNSVIRFRFTNPATRDFILSEARVQFIEGENAETIHFEGIVRQIQRHRLEITNTSSRPATFQCMSTHQDLSFNPQPFSVPPQSSGMLDLVMRPTLPGRGESNVVLQSDELGTFKYLVKYDVRSPGIEKRVTLAAPLGKEVQQVVRFLHFGRKATSYQLSLAPSENSDLLQKPVNLAEVFVFESKGTPASPDTDGQGVEICFPVKFVPSRLQEFKAILCARGTDGQEFKALLVGRTLAPEAQGPLKVPRAKGLSIDFKNPMDLATEFTAHVDQTAFVLDKKTFRLEGRKSATVTVSLKTDQRILGRLLITTEGLPPWIIYLKAD